MWVLIVLMAATGTGGGVAINTNAVFATQAACEHAANQSNQRDAWQFGHIRAFCVAR